MEQNGRAPFHNGKQNKSGEQYNSKGFSAKIIASSGILAALTMTCLILASYLPTSKLTMYAIASFFISVPVIEFGAGAGWTFYVATSLLAFIIVPDKMKALLYLFFFGIYGLVKHYAEKSPAVSSYLIKMAFFNLSALLCYFVAKELLDIEVPFNFSLWLLVPAAQLVFLIYDYAYTLFIRIYMQRLRRFLK